MHRVPSSEVARVTQSVLTPDDDIAAYPAGCHVYPLSGREHITTGAPCWCFPRVDHVDPDSGSAVVVHNREQ